MNRKEGAENFKYGLLISVIGGYFTYGEIYEWNSMINFIPGILLYPIVTIIGIVMAVRGLYAIIVGK